MSESMEPKMTQEDDERARILKLIEPLASESRREIREHLEMLDNTIENNQSAINDLEEQAEGKSGDIADAVNAVLDEVERPVGTLNAMLPQSPHSSRALVGLYAAIGRTL